jgi:hypothetical protein
MSPHLPNPHTPCSTRLLLSFSSHWIVRNPHFFSHPPLHRLHRLQRVQCHTMLIGVERCGAFFCAFLRPYSSPTVMHPLWSAPQAGIRTHSNGNTYILMCIRMPNLFVANPKSNDAVLRKLAHALSNAPTLVPLAALHRPQSTSLIPTAATH